MSPHRQTATARDRHARLGLVRLEDREVPAVLTLGIDPAVNMNAAVGELRAAFGKLASFDEPNTINLFPGGVYVFDNTNTTGGLALGAVNPTSSQKSATLTYLTVNGNGAVLRRAATSPDPADPAKTVPTNPFSFLTLRGDANGYGVARIADLTFDGGSSAGSGGAVTVDGVPVAFDGVRFANNAAAVNGGAVVFGSSAVAAWVSRFDDCTFADNAAGKDGGAVALSDGDLGSFLVENKYTFVLSQTRFTGNAAGANGGAVSARDDDFLLSGVSMAGNTAGGFGGGLYATADTWRTNSTEADNSKFGNTVGAVNNTTIDGNTAKAGGGVYIDGGWIDVRFYNSTVTFNAATGKAAGDVPGAGGIQRVNTLPVPDDFLAVAKRPGNTYVRAELAFTAVAGNTSAVAVAAADMKGVFFDPTPVTRNQLSPVPNSLAYGTNFVGVADGIVGAGNIILVAASGTAAAPADPVLGPLQDSGGGLLTRLPQPGSPLIDAGRSSLYAELLASPGVPATSDNRGGGYNRIAFGERSKRLDIGAAEVQAAGSVSLLTVSGDGQAAAARAAFGQPLVLRTLDRYGAPLEGQQVAAAVIPAGAGAEFPLGATATTDANGFATLYPVANKTVGSYQQLVQVGQSTVAFDLTNRQRLNFIELPTEEVDGTLVDVSGNNQSATVATDFAQPLKVLVSRADSSPVAGAAVTFLARPAGADTGQFVTLSAPGAVVAAGGRFVTVLTDADGFATVTATAGQKAGAVSVLASANGFDANGAPTAAAAVSFTLTTVAGAATKLGFLTNDPTGAASGSGQSALVPNRFQLPLQVLASDQFGNFSSDVQVTFTSNTDPATGAGAKFQDPADPTQFTQPTATVNTAGGIASVPVAAGSKVGTYTVTATAAGLTPVTFTLANLPGLPAGVVAVSGGGQAATVTDPAVSSGVAGAFPERLVVRVTDAGGNPVPDASVLFQGPGVGASARAEPVSLTTGADGTASVAAVPNSVSGTYQFTAQVQTGAGTFATTTFTLTNAPGLPASVTVLAGGGQTARAGDPFAQPIVVRVLDQYQNPVPGVTPAVSSPGAALTATPTGADGLSTVTATAGGAVGPTAATVAVGGLTDTVSLTVEAQPRGAPEPLVGVPTVTATGLGGGIASRVTVYNPDGNVRTRFAPFDPGFLGGTRVAIARTPDAPTVVAVPGPGRFPDARVFSADDGTELAAFQPFEQTFTGGLFVSAADIDRDGYDDYVFSPDVGGGPRVQVRSGRTGAVLQDFFGIEDPNFRGGARTAVGDVNGDGTPDLVVAAGVGGGPRIAVYDGKSLIGFRAVPVKLVGDFFAFEQTLRNGAYVAAGDVNGDGAAEVLLGGGPGGGPRVRVLDGRVLAAGGQQVVTDFFAGPSTDRGGVTVTVRNLDGDARNDIVTGSGSGTGSRVSVYLGRDLRPGQPLANRSFDDLGGFTGGVFVG